MKPQPVLKFSWIETVRSMLSLFVFVWVLSGCSAVQKTDGAINGRTRPTAPSSVGSGAAPASQQIGHARRIPLQLEGFWQLNLPLSQRFDASGLFEQKNGTLLTINDREAAVYQIKFQDGANSADLIKIPDCFTPNQLAPFAKEKIDRYDIEGIAGDVEGRIYLSEEANRWILRWDSKTRKVERLDIDWTPVQKYFHPTDRNASFEGVAVGEGRIYVANERQSGRIIVVDQKTLKVIDDFMPRPSTAALGDIHYSDLSWFDGHLYVLLR
ncbi:MAG: SdiA-regulated, partial [Verrucomicrobiales bacterium]|nr:SdiA-regulated [Verrucomicrobiales bacterium]